MRRWKTWMTLVLMVLSLGMLTASDVECEDGDFEFDWPSISYDHDGCGGDCGGFYYEEYSCGPWWDCWF